MSAKHEYEVLCGDCKDNHVKVYIPISDLPSDLAQAIANREEVNLIMVEIQELKQSQEIELEPEELQKLEAGGAVEILVDFNDSLVCDSCGSDYYRDSEGNIIVD